MNYDKKTPKREITISEVVLKVISPFVEGQVITAEEANVLNQTLAENLRNNFAPRVKAVKEAAGSIEAVDLASLQGELDTYTSEYTFGARRGGGVAVDPITKIATSLAREQVKKALVKAGKNLKDIAKEDIDALATRAVEQNPKFRELAAQQHAIKQASANEVLADIAA